MSMNATRKNEVSALAGTVTNLLLENVVNPELHMDWRDTVFAAALAIKAVGMVAMDLDRKPLTPEQTLECLTQTFQKAMNTVVVPLPRDDDANTPGPSFTDEH